MQVWGVFGPNFKFRRQHAKLRKIWEAFAPISIKKKKKNLNVLPTPYPGNLKGEADKKTPTPTLMSRRRHSFPSTLCMSSSLSPLGGGIAGHGVIANPSLWRIHPRKGSTKDLTGSLTILLTRFVMLLYTRITTRLKCDFVLIFHLFHSRLKKIGNFGEVFDLGMQLCAWMFNDFSILLLSENVPNDNRN